MNAAAKIIIFIVTIIKIIILFLILVTLFGALLPYIEDASEYAYLQPLITLDTVIQTNIASHIPKINHTDISRVLIIIIFAILYLITAKLKKALEDRLRKLNMQDEIDVLKTKTVTQAQRQSLTNFEQRIESTDLRGKSRQQLLKDFIQLKKELEKTGRNLAFLAIDVVDSTGMKAGEDSAVVENDFNEYRNFITNKFKEAGYIKASWTPDGVMACFNTTEQAIAAARSILNGLNDFNESVKTMKRDFNIRCGINTGYVYYDLSTPLEEFSDRVIDIAGHMQKHAKVNTILVAKEIINPIKTYEDFETSKVMVDGMEVCEWKLS